MDRVLRDAAPTDFIWLSGQAWEELFARKCIRRPSGAPYKEGDKENAGVKVVVELPAPGIGLHPAAALPPVYLAPDQTWAIFAKDAGSPSYPLFPWETNTFVNRVCGFVVEAGMLTEPAFRGLASPPILEGGLTQRLDTDTSGIVCVTFTKEHKAAFRTLISRHEVVKRYHAIVHGDYKGPAEIKALLDHYEGKKMRVVKEGGQIAEIKIKLLSRSPRASLLEVETRYGVRHLVRALLAEAGYPLAGDALYGAPKSALTQHQLHAYGLALASTHPLFPDFDFTHLPPRIFCENLTAFGLEFSYA